MKSGYINFYTTGLDACSPNKNWYERGLVDCLCPECKILFPRVGAIDVFIQEKRPKPSPITFVIGSVNIVHRDFLNILGADSVENDLMIGSVINGDGENLKDWASVRSKVMLHIRGTENIRNNGRCSTCYRPYVSATGKKYIYPDTNSPGTIFSTLFGALLVRADRIDGQLFKPKKGFGVAFVPVLDQPFDGLDFRIECWQGGGPSGIKSGWLD